MSSTYGWSGSIFSGSTTIEGMEKFDTMNVAELAYEWAETYKQKLIDAAAAAAPVGQHYDLDGTANPDSVDPRYNVKLRDSIQAQKSISGTRVRLQLTSNAPQAQYVLKGTSPHQILGNPVLAFFWAAIEQAMFPQFVNHPGNEPNPFMKQVGAEQTPAMRSSLVEYLNKRMHG